MGIITWIFQNWEVTFPTNGEKQALILLKGLKKKLRSYAKYSEDGNIFMEGLLEKKHAERIPEDELCREDNMIYAYSLPQDLPPTKTGKGSAFYSGLSLNRNYSRDPTC